MNRFSALQAEHAALQARAETVIQAAETRAAAGESATFTADEDAAIRAIEAQLATVNANLAQEDRLRALRRDPVATPAVETYPNTRVSDIRDRATDKPWGHDYGIARLSDSPRDRKLASDIAAGDHALAVYRAALNPHGTDAARLMQYGAATGMNESNPADGGFLVQTDQSRTMLERVYDIGEISRRLTASPVGENANGIAVPFLNETSRVDGSRWGGLRGYWTGEAATYTTSRPTYDKFRLDLDKVTALVAVTDEMMSDVAFLGAWLNRMAPIELNFKLENAVMNGDGIGKPIGILRAPALIVVAKETGQAADTIVTENIVNMFSRLWAPSANKAIWLVNQNVYPQLHTMSLSVGVGGVPVYLPPSGLAGRPAATLYGLPVIPVEYAATLGDEGDISLVDFDQYALIEKGGVQFASSIHVYFSTGEQAFRYTYRVNGAPWWKSALTPLNGTTTVSPYITLAARA